MSRGGSRGIARGRQSTFVHTFHVNGNAPWTLTNQPLAEAFALDSARTITKLDLSDYTEVRLVGHVQTLSAVVGSQVNLQYRTAYSETPADYTPIGTSAVSVSLEATGAVSSSWVPLATLARADVFVAVISVGGDADADPQIGNLSAQFR